MQQSLKETRFIIRCIIITFLSMSVLGTLFAAIQGIILMILILWIIVTFWLNPVFVIAAYFKIKKLIDNYRKLEYTDVEWTLIKFNIILAQLAGVTMAHSLALCIHKDFFMITFGRFALWSVDVGMGITLVIMLLVTGMKDFYLVIKTLLRSKEKVAVITQNKGLTRILLVFIVLMMVLTLTGFLLGKKLERYPSLEELVQNKAEYILRHMDYIETIREYIEDLDYEEITASKESPKKVGNIKVFHSEKDGYGILYLDVEEVLEDIGLEDINIVKYTDIRVEFDTKTYKVRKIHIPVKYEQTGKRNTQGGSLVWYSSDYVNRESGFILDDNWLIQWLERAG